MSWETVKLSSVAEVIAGQSPESKFYNNNGIGVPFFQGKADFGNDYPTVRYWCDQPTKIAKPLDILFSVRAPVGPTNICDVEACIGRGLAAIRTGDSLYYKFLYFYFKSVEEKLASQGNGSTFSAITTSVLKDLEIPLPPLTTQKRIAEILDAADALRRKDQELLKKYDELAQAIFIDMFGDPVKNEKGWERQIATKYYEVRGRVGWKGYKKTDLRQNGAIVIGATHITNTGDIDLSNPVFLSEQKFVESPEIVVQKNDLIFVQRGNTIGKIGLVRDDIAKATINPVVLIFRPKDVNPFFLLYLILNKEQNREFVSSNSGSAQPMITQEFMRNYYFVNIPKVLQDEFGTNIKLIENQKNKAKNSLKKSESLFQSLIQKAFNGELAE